MLCFLLSFYYYQLMTRLPPSLYLLLLFFLGGCQTTKQVTIKNDFTKSLPNVEEWIGFAGTASEVKNGVLVMTIKPGMVGATSDPINKTERIEFGTRVTGYSWVTQSFKVKVGKKFRADKRTLIAQIKPWVNGMSPAVSVNLDRGGRVKCVDSDNSQAIALTNSYSINLTDGKWHTVVMNYFKSDSNGYCEVIIDGTKIIKLTDFNSYHGVEETTARIGIYRDALPYNQTVFFDDWVVKKQNDREPNFSDKRRVFKDNDWNTTFVETCPTKNKGAIKLVNEGTNSFLRVTLNSGEKGSCPGDKETRTYSTLHSSPGIKQIKSRFIEREELYQSSNILKNKKYKLEFNVRFFRGNGTFNEEFFTLGGRGKSLCSGDAVSLYFGRNIFGAPEEMRKIGIKRRVSNKRKAEPIDKWSYDTVPVQIDKIKKKWNRVRIIFDTTEKPKASIFWNNQMVANNWNFAFRSRCKNIAINIGNRRPHYPKYGRTSIFDFDKITLIEVN